MEKPVAEIAAKTNPELAVGECIYEDKEGGNAVGIAKGNEDLVEIVNDVIERITNDGTMDQYIEEAIILSDQEVTE